MGSSTSGKGRKIEGFSGLFDVLGYSKMVESMKDDLDDLINIYTNTLMNVDDLALSLEGKKKFLLASIETKSFAFSDTIVLYQDMPKGPVIMQTPTINAFLGEVCYLLRLAFERGIPLRGAVSFGEYYVQEDKSCFLGYPVIEAHKKEKEQMWSGAILCESAWNKLYTLHNESLEMQGEWRGIDLKGRFSPLINPLWEKYPIPYKSSISDGIALCWHDEILDFLRLEKIPRIKKNELENVGQFVGEKFSAHGKNIDSDDVKLKMKNTAIFLGSMQMRYLLRRGLFYSVE